MLISENFPPTFYQSWKFFNFNFTFLFFTQSSRLWWAFAVVIENFQFQLERILLRFSAILNLPHLMAFRVLLQFFFFRHHPRTISIIARDFFFLIKLKNLKPEKLAFCAMALEWNSIWRVFLTYVRAGEWRLLRLISSLHFLRVLKNLVITKILLFEKQKVA